VLRKNLRSILHHPRIEFLHTFVCEIELQLIRRVGVFFAPKGHQLWRKPAA